MISCRVTALQSWPLFQFFFYKKYTVIKKPTATIFEWEVPKRIAFLKSGFRKTLFVLGPLTRKLWPCLFFVTVPIFAGRSRFAALSRLRTGITRTRKFFTYLSYRYSESWVRGESVGAGPRKVSICKFGATDRFIKKKQIFTDICVPPPLYKVSACCELNFDATMLPHSSFEALCPKHFRGAPKVDLT